MSYTSRVRIHAQEPDYELWSYGKGAAYELRRGTRSVFLQGDDASDFRAQYEQVTEAASKPGHVARAGALAWLWDQCGYGEVADDDT